MQSTKEILPSEKNLATPQAARCRGVVKEFGSGQAKVRVLRGIDMDIHAGETTFLVGPSGCGKTTLISVIAGLLRPNEGTVELFGEKTSKMPCGKLVRFRSTQLGFIFQQFNLLPSLTAAENAAVP